ncbi:MAG: hypothetical protein LBC07_03660, partial [Elusimicrobiota bacterium]|nr:hypothetical protein [Elusimicrobiota bacterium]
EQKSSAQVSYNAAGPVQWENHQVFVIRQAAIGPSSQDAKRDREMLAQIRQEQIQFQRKLNDLIEKYSQTQNEKDKLALTQEIRSLVYEQITKELAQKKQILNMQMARIKDLEKRLDEIEKNKTAYVDDSVKYLTSPEGILQIQRANAGLGKNIIIEAR